MAAAAPEAENLQYEMNPEDIQMFDLEKKRKILAVLFFENKIGAAFYSEDNEMLYVFVDSEESSPHFEIFEMLVTQIEPTTIVLNVNCNDILKQKANNLMSDVESMPSIPGDVEIESDSREPQPSTSSGPKNRTSVSSNRSPNVSYIPERYFNEQYARKKLMDYVENKDRRTEESRFVFLSSLINTTNSNLWRSIGGLIKFLEVVEEKTGDKICVIGLQSFFPENRMFVENTTVEALQIFKCDWHPSAYKSGSFKDGFCVFSKFNRCITRVGKAYMRKIFQHPLTDLPTINERLNFLEIFGQPERTTICDDIKFHIKYVAPMHKVVKRMMIGHAPIKDWRMLHRTLRSAIEIFGFLRNCDESIAKSTLVERYLQVYRSDVISNLFETIDRTIDFRKSLKEDVFHVNPGVCETLDKQTELYIQLPNILSAEFENDIPLLRGVVEDAQMVYLPQIGFVIKVPLMGGEANGNIQGLEFRAVADGNAFYKSSTCVRLDNDIGDIECLMQDERVTIMYSLQDDVLRTAGYIYEAIDILAEIDCFVAMAEVSRECNYIRPVFNENNEYEIIGGRHFLQECCVDNFVANDYKSENTKGKVKIITGANASGKSIYLKQICLISYMAQIGCFVPAEKALLPIIDRMYSRIQTVESVSTNVSAFCFDLNQVSMSVRNATARSLVALDEFGKGTELSQGLALLAATINYWLRRDTTPFLLVSTHLLSIPQFLIKTPKLEFQTFEVIVTEEKVVYTYSIKDGIAKSSLAHAVARSAGISNQILDRAKYISDKLAKGEDFEPLPNAEYDAHVAKCRAVGRAFNSIKAELRAIEDQDLRLQKFKEFLESIKDV